MAQDVLVKTAPVYPTLASSMNIHGVVKIEALIAPNGTVEAVDVKGGHPLFPKARLRLHALVDLLRREMDRQICECIPHSHPFGSAQGGLFAKEREGWSTHCVARASART